MKRAAWTVAGGVAALVAGCGQKGPLYLPDKNPRVVTTPATQPQPAPAQSAPAEKAPAAPLPPKPDRKPYDQSGEAETAK
jgi:predicted small lipoprotein YifL